MQNIYVIKIFKYFLKKNINFEVLISQRDFLKFIAIHWPSNRLALSTSTMVPFV